MTQEGLDCWLSAYRRAWQERQPATVSNLFTEDATYQETPFVEPLRGRAAIRQYWTDVVVRAQEQIKFDYEIVVIHGNTALAHWWASFTRTASGKRILLNGIFLLTFDSENQCSSLREWWHKLAEDAS
jgi:uncharacterized protein (TIGR02246 family)